MFNPRPTWTRGLTFWEPTPEILRELSSVIVDVDGPPVAPPQAFSRFRSRANPWRFALYSLGEMSPPGSVLVRLGSDDHTLVVRREFRRVPLNASALSLALFTTRPGRVAEAVAALAHFAERAVSVWEPAYLMLAQSVEHPRLIVLLAGVHRSRALADGCASPFSLDALMPDLRPMLVDEPEVFDYCREARAEELPALVSQRAV